MEPESLHTEETVVQLDPVLDGSAALRARALVEGAPPGDRVVLDFGRVRDVEYIALTSLLLATARLRGHPVALRGLCEQHVRVLRYLGVDVDRLVPRDGTDAGAEPPELAVRRPGAGPAADATSAPAA
jgi:anti-anti-sigma regulatory factor